MCSLKLYKYSAYFNTLCFEENKWHCISFNLGFVGMLGVSIIAYLCCLWVYYLFVAAKLNVLPEDRGGI